MKNRKGKQKVFFLKNFPNLFKQKSLDYLCKIIPEEVKLIHVPEIVKDSNGNIAIQDSFLFPIPRKNKIVWVWESNIDLKASYLFETKKNNDDFEIQQIYNFITGDIINKRLTLIRSKKLKEELNCSHRVIHNSYETWKNEITNILK